MSKDNPMHYAQHQRSPVKHLTGIAVAVILHLLVIYMLVNSSAHRMMELIQLPLEVKIIEERPKLPDTPPPPPAKLQKLPPAFVPPPEVQVRAQAEPPATIANITHLATPVEPAPPARRAGRGTGLTVGAGAPGAGVACPNSQQIRAETSYPEQARRDKLEGNVLVEFTLLANGSIIDLDIKSSSDRVFNTVSVNAVRQFICTGQGSDTRISVPFVFKLGG